MEVQNTVTKSNTKSVSNSLVDTLKAQAIKDKTFNAVCHVWAGRERARQQVTIPALTAVMKKNGFKFDRKDYEGVLKFMAASGLGILEKSPKGRIRAVKGIKITLQSIGQVALGEGTLKKYRTQNRFTQLPGMVKNTIIETEVGGQKPLPPPATKTMCKVTFQVTVDGKTVNFEIPEGVPKEDLGQFIGSLYPRKPRGAA